MVPEETALAYAANALTMANRVSHRVLSHPKAGELFHELPAQLLEVNHRNHATFIAEVLRTGSYSLLWNAIPWVYHAYHNQGVPYEYWPIQLSAWKDVITETLGEPHVEPVLGLYNLMLEAHEQHVETAEARQREPSPVVADAETPHAAFLAALLAGDEARLLMLSRDYLDADHSFLDLVQRRIYPAMIDVGTCWERGEIRVADEHQATSIVNFVLSALYLEADFKRPWRGQALVATVADEFHELGAWMLTASLELDGWNVTFLGCDADRAGVIEAALARPLSFIALSITLPSHLGSARSLISELRMALGADCPPIVVGGRVFFDDPELAETVGADLALQDIEAALEWARGLPV
jgi:methanogenic corrinoid protein MtbC1